jgi:hypothetical protein
MLRSDGNSLNSVLKSAIMDVGLSANFNSLTVLLVIAPFKEVAATTFDSKANIA